jgi:hypothetical protein
MDTWAPVLDASGNNVVADSSGTATFTATSATSPSITSLTGTVFASGTANPALTVAGPQQITFGTTQLSLSGSLADANLAPVGDQITATLGPLTSTAVVGAGGSFSVSFNPKNLPVGGYSIAYSFAGDKSFTSAAASGTLTIGIAARSAYILNTAASGALTASGNASVVLPGGLYVDSSSSSAIQASGSAVVNAGNPVLVVGGVSASGKAQVTKTSVPTTTNDPFSILGLPNPSGLPSNGPINVSGNSSMPLSPGIYPSIQVSGHGSVTLSPGWYIIEGGGLNVSGNGSLSGTGVTIFNVGSGYSYNATTGVVTDGGTYGSIAMGGNGTINLTAPTSGAYAGVVLFQSRGNSKGLSLSGNSASGITGTIYAPAAAALLSGNAQLTGSLVVSTLAVTGNAGAFELSDGASSDYTASTANWITNGVLTVAVQDDTGNGLDPNEVARIDDAMSFLNQTLGSFGVYLSWAAPGTSADVHIHFASSTPEGSAADGVIGFTTTSNDVYFVATGWSYYTGSDASAIGSGQYDFQTLATHELAHTVGLGESIDPSSVMNEYLASGTVRRSFTDSNLALINTVSDRFMKAALPVMHGSQTLPAQAASASLFSPESALLLNQESQIPLGGVKLLASVAPLWSSLAATIPGLHGEDRVLVGGAGNDVVLGGQGHNLMVGGFGHEAAHGSGTWATDLVLSLSHEGDWTSAAATDWLMATPRA